MNTVQLKEADGRVRRLDFIAWREDRCAFYVRDESGQTRVIEPQRYSGLEPFPERDVVAIDAVVHGKHRWKTIISWLEPEDRLELDRWISETNTHDAAERRRRRKAGESSEVLGLVYDSRLEVDRMAEGYGTELLVRFLRRSGHEPWIEYAYFSPRVRREIRWRLTLTGGATIFLRQLHEGCAATGLQKSAGVRPCGVPKIEWMNACEGVRWCSGDNEPWKEQRWREDSKWRKLIPVLREKGSLSRSEVVKFGEFKAGKCTVGQTVEAFHGQKRVRELLDARVIDWPSPDRELRLTTAAAE